MMMMGDIGKRSNILLIVITICVSLVGVFLSGLGVVLVYLGATGNSDVNLFGNELSSESVGVTSVFIGAVVIILILKRILSSHDAVVSKFFPSTENNSDINNKKSEVLVQNEKRSESQSFIQGKFICREYKKEKFYINDISISARILHKVFIRNDLIPDIILGVNQGGTIMAATLATMFGSKRIGVIYIAKNGVEPFISDPKDIKSSTKKVSDSKPILKILLLDTKLKSGSSSLKIIKALQKYYGNNFELDISFGFAIVYNDNNDKRREVINNTIRWPITLKIDSSKNIEKGPTKIDKIYCAYYLKRSFEKEDNIWEELRADDPFSSSIE